MAAAGAAASVEAGADGDGEAAEAEAAATLAADVRTLNLISADLSRTLPSLALFGPGELLHAKLREVLWTYCAALPDGVAYVQGLSHVAAVLVLHVPEPPLACACLASLLSGYPILRACGMRTHARAHAHTRTRARTRRTRTRARHTSLGP